MLLTQPDTVLIVCVTLRCLFSLKGPLDLCQVLETLKGLKCPPPVVIDQEGDQDEEEPKDEPKKPNKPKKDKTEKPKEVNKSSSAKKTNYNYKPGEYQEEYRKFICEAKNRVHKEALELWQISDFRISLLANMPDSELKRRRFKI